MAETRDFLALDWVKGEIEETLKQAQQALEAHVENPEDETRLRFCLTYLHQVYGTLQMVEFYGAALLAEELEKLTQALLGGKVARVADAQEVLMRGMLQLPAYLDRIKASRRDMPVVLLPLLNDLRAARGEKLLSEGALFRPDISATEKQGANIAGAEAGAGAVDPDLAALLRKVRQMFQLALLGFIRGENLPVNLGHMARAMAKLEKISGTAAIVPLWRVGGAVVEGLLGGSIDAGTATRLLLGQVDRQIKLLIEQGAPAFASDPPTDLFKNLLFYVARSGAESPQIVAMRALYKLDDALLAEETIDEERTKLAGPDRQTMASVAGAISEELSRVKEALDIFMRGGAQASVGDLGPHIGTLKQLADTIALLGFGPQRQMIREQYEILEKIVADNALEDPAILMDVAGALLYVEATLAGESGRSRSPVPVSPQDALAQDEISKARAVVVQECRVGLDLAKEKIGEYIASQWDRVHIQEIPNILVSVRGGLQIAGMDRAAAVLVCAGEFVRHKLLATDEKPEWKHLETLADAISSIEYFLERIVEDPGSGDHILAIAEQSVAALGYDVSAVAAAGVTAADADAIEEITMAAPATIAGDFSDELNSEPSLDVPMTAAAEGKQSFADEEVPLVDEEALAAALLMEDQDVPAPAPVAIAGDADAEQAAVDEEIVEIFVEEIAEVMAHLDAHFPQWVANQQDEFSLKEFRRGFHTLKGSGRMVGAKYLGELAWSIENMLNRVMDRVIVPTPVMIDLIRAVKNIVPDMVEAFAAGRRSPWIVEPLMECAGAFARGEQPAVVPPLQPCGASAAPAIEDAFADMAPEWSAAQAMPTTAPAITHDPALLEVFSAESEQHVAAIDAWLAAIDPDLSHHPITDDLLRALHTLKGSARMAGIMPVAEIAGPTEKFCKDLRNNGEMADADVVALVREATSLVRLRINRLLPDPHAPIPGAQSYLEMLAAIQSSRQEARATAVPDNVLQVYGVQARPGLISELLAEGMDHVLDGGDYAAQWSQQGVVSGDLEAMCVELRRLIDTSTRGGLAPMTEMAQRLRRVYDAIQNGNLMLSSNVLGALQAGHESIIAMMDCMAAHQNIQPALEAQAGLDAICVGLPEDVEKTDTDVADMTAAQASADMPVKDFADFLLSEDDVAASRAEVLAMTGSVEPEISSASGQDDGSEDNGETPDIPERDAELVAIFMEEANEIVESATAALEAWLGNVGNLIEVQKLQRDLHTLKGGARMAEIQELGDLAHELENIYEGLSQGTLSVHPTLPGLLHRCHDRIADMVQDIQVKGWCRNGRDLIAQIHAWIKNPAGFVVESSAMKLASASKAVDVRSAAVPAPNARPMIPAADEVVPTVSADILDVFLEEAEDLSSQLEAAITSWRREPGNTGYVDQMKRVLHTLKGGARLAGMKRLGDISHTFENRVIDLWPKLPDESFFADLAAWHDEIVAQVEKIRVGGAAAAVAVNAEAGTTRTLPPEKITLAESPLPVPIVPAAVELTQGDDDVVPVRNAGNEPPERRVAARQAQPQEMVKVASDLLEKLVNLAGETSINRSRIEQQITDFKFTISDMGSTISRLADQLRRLDAEADSQVRANWEKGVAEGKYSGDFDPLEMDQYSGLHQLTKQLFESASDLLDIRDTLVNKSRDTETLLLQQSRVNTELQEGLMRSRMVQFLRLTPRLRRIVRQVAGELKKNIEIDFINPEGEMDRALLERIVAPLEHMLRNACDHGIEAPDVRIASGKPAQGRIRLTLSREGGEVVLTVADDGKGINVNAVRKKAIERGLMDDASELADQEVMQFILEAGFSTAEKVTQISGRGVGMDVVSSEIKQMGGALMIHSEVGVGTTFEIRLPFTVSVNRALMVRVGEDQFAIPLAQIAGIVRVSSYELETYYHPDAPLFEYAGESWRLSYLGGFVHGVAAPDLRGTTMPLPVLLVRGSDHTVAIQVDQLIGSREVVVKAVGPQLSTVAGLSGATILGDGRVVVILDLLSLIRAAHLQHAMAQAQRRRLAARSEAEKVVVTSRVREVPLIMVTDDSVTVRKVTGRFLERQGFEVITARDGMDAVAQLADIKPDLMLLDIEMPRMDGFEVASHCRHDDRLKDLPIIMITSRTGEKHRDRAKEIGVNAYLGKPFQENELLAKIQELLAERRAQAQHG